MAQYRQSGGLSIINNGGGGVGAVRNGLASDHVSVGIRSNKQQQQQQQSRIHHRRLKPTTRKISIGAIIVILFVAFVVSVSAFFYFTSQNKGNLDNTFCVCATNFVTFMPFEKGNAKLCWVFSY